MFGDLKYITFFIVTVILKQKFCFLVVPLRYFYLKGDRGGIGEKL